MRRLLMVAQLGLVLAMVCAFAAGPTTAPGEPSRTSPSPAGGGVLLWIWLAAGAVLLAALVLVTLRVRRPGR